MIKYVASYFTLIAVMALLDFLWIGFIAKHLYQTGIGHLMAEKPNLMAAGLFYLIFCGGLMWFAVLPQALDSGVTRSLVSAGIFGLCAYATYDLTNLATLKDWPWSVTLVDMAWGTFASVAAVAAGSWVLNKLAA